LHGDSDKGSYKHTMPSLSSSLPPSLQALQHKPNHILDDSFMAVYIEELRRRMREQVGRLSPPPLPPSSLPSIFLIFARSLLLPSLPPSLAYL